MITLYTDGSCLQNPGPGGWAFLALDEASTPLHQSYGPEAQTTNNQMELQAVIEALRWASSCGHSEAVVVTDSRYVQQGMLQWLANWKRNNWKTSNKGPVKNQEYWKSLDALSSQISVQWQWVKAHHTDPHNAHVDTLARQAAMSLENA